MRLEPIFDIELDYEGGFFVIAPYGGTEGVGYGAVEAESAESA